MWNALKLPVLAVAGLLVLAILAVGILSLIGGARLQRSYDIALNPVTVPTDAAAIARGAHLVNSVLLCKGCHGDGLEGKLLFEAPNIATVYAPNLTAGQGGRGAVYSDLDFERAIRHGVNAEGRGLMIMHSDAYHHLSAEDLGAVIAYVRSLPPVDNEVPAPETHVLGRAMVALGMFDSDAMPLIPAEVIDHDAATEPAPAPGATAEYGGYLVSLALCRMCHGADLQGGEPIEEGAPSGPTLAPYGVDGGWNTDEFIHTIRTGTTPYGYALAPDHMPWEVFSGMTDQELGAIHAYLRSLAWDSVPDPMGG